MQEVYICMISSELYVKVAEKCSAYDSIANMVNGKMFVSCTSCENFKNGACLINYIGLVSIEKIGDVR